MPRFTSLTIERRENVAALYQAFLAQPVSKGAGGFGSFKPIALFREEPDQFFA
jgi:hypothetical protein